MSLISCLFNYADVCRYPVRAKLVRRLCYLLVGFELNVVSETVSLIDKLKRAMTSHA